MRPSHKYRLKMAILGVAVLAVELEFVNPLHLIFLPTNTGNFFVDSTNGLLRFSGAALLIPFIIGMIVGGVALALSLRPMKFQHRYCSNCKTFTEQFHSSTKKDKKEPTLVTNEYTCERCGNKNIVRLSKNRTVISQEKSSEPLATWECKCGRIITAAVTPHETVQCAQCGELYNQKTVAQLAASQRDQIQFLSASTKPTSGKRLCIECGNELPPNLMFCNNCGAKQP